MEFQESRLMQGIRSQFDTVIVDKQKEIYNVVNSLVPKEEKEALENLKKQFQSIGRMKSEMDLNIREIKDIAENLNDVLDRMSQKVMKIKADLELRCNNIENDVRYLQKGRETVDGKFQEVGRVFAFFSETVGVILSSLLSGEVAQQNLQ